MCVCLLKTCVHVYIRLWIYNVKLYVRVHYTKGCALLCFIVECPALWVSGSEPAVIVRCLSGMIGLVYALYIYMDRRAVVTFV